MRPQHFEIVRGTVGHVASWDGLSLFALRYSRRPSGNRYRPSVYLWQGRTVFKQSEGNLLLVTLRPLSFWCQEKSGRKCERCSQFGKIMIHQGGTEYMSAARRWKSILMCAPPAAARKPSAERKGISLFAFPAMSRWAFFYRPAKRDCATEVSGQQQGAKMRHLRMLIPGPRALGIPIISPSA